MSNTFSKLPILEIIEWIEDDPNRVMWKVPDGDREIKNGAKLIVRESQTAMFMNEGQIADVRSEEHTSELQSLMRISYAVFCLQKKNKQPSKTHKTQQQAEY